MSTNDQGAQEKPANANAAATKWGSLGAFIAIAIIAVWRIHHSHEEAANFIAMCDAPLTKTALENAVASTSGTSGSTIRLTDVRDATELKASKAARLCSATLALSTGDLATRFIVSRSAQGATQVQIGQGLDLGPSGAPISTTQTASAGGAPVAAAPASPAPGTPNTSDVPSLYPVAFQKWRQAVTGLGFSDKAWAADLNGTSDNLRKLQFEGQTYEVGLVCQEHNCADANAFIMVSEDQSRVLGLLHAIPDGGQIAQDTLVGAPSNSEARCLVKLAQENQTSCG